MAALQRALGHGRQIAVDRHAALGLHGLFEPRIGHGRHAVENHARDAAVRAEGLIAAHHGGGGEGHALGIDHQHRRGRERLGHREGRRAVGIHGQAVVIAHRALDDVQIGRAPDEPAAQAVFVQKIGVEVAAGRADDLRMEHGVDVVRAALEGSHVLAPVLQRLKQCTDHGGLAAAGAGSGDEHAVHSSHRPQGTSCPRRMA